MKQTVPRLASLTTVLALAACGGGGGGGSGTPVGPSACSPAAQTGCGSGQKCAWIQTDEMGGGATGCVPAGTVAALGACTYGPAGTQTGFDDCAAGLACVGGECRPICDLAARVCPQHYACGAYAGLFVDSGAGACDPTCNPLTQTRDVDGAAACASPEPATPTRGCYGAPDGAFTCAPVVSDAVHREAPLGPSPGSAYLNGCAPGYLPLLRESSASSAIVCIALCDPVETYLGSSSERQGRSPYSCPDAGATGTGEECRFWWFLEASPDTTLTPYSNVLGFCLDHTQYTYNDPVEGEVTFPSCADVPQGEALDWACVPHP